MHNQPIITFLPLNNDYLFNNSSNNFTSTTATTGTTTSTIAHEIGSTTSRTTTTNNNNKPDIYFEVPLSNRDLSSSVQTVYRLLYTDNSGRTIITNESALINEAGHVIINNDSINNNNNNHGVSSENNSNNVLNAISILGAEYSPYHSSSCASSSTDHYTIDHLPNIINRQRQSIPCPYVGFSPLSSASTLTTASTLSVPLLSIGNTFTLSSTALKLQQSKHSSVTTSNMTNRLQTSNQHNNHNINNNLDEIHVDFMNGMSNTGTTTTSTTNTTTTATARNATNISFDGGNQLISGYHHQIKMDDSCYSSSSVVTTATNPMMSKGHYHNVHNNNDSSTTTNNNIRNNSLLTLPSLSSMTCHLTPVEPKPDQLRTLQSVSCIYYVLSRFS